MNIFKSTQFYWLKIILICSLLYLLHSCFPIIHSRKLAHNQLYVNCNKKPRNIWRWILSKRSFFPFAVFLLARWVSQILKTICSQEKLIIATYLKSQQNCVGHFSCYFNSLANAYNLNLRSSEWFISIPGENNFLVPFCISTVFLETHYRVHVDLPHISSQYLGKILEFLSLP